MESLSGAKKTIKAEKFDSIKKFDNYMIVQNFKMQTKLIEKFTSNEHSKLSKPIAKN